MAPPYRYFQDSDYRKNIGCLFERLKADRNVIFQSLYEGTINSTDFDTTENKYLLCGTSSGVIAIYDASLFSGKRYFSPVAHIGKSNPCCPSHVGTVSWYPCHTGLFASSGDDGILYVWDTNYLKPLEKYRIGSAIYHHAFGLTKSCSSLIAVVGDRYNMRIIDFRIGSSSHSLNAQDASAVCVAWSPVTENLLCSGHMNGCCFLWDIRSCKKPLGLLNKIPRNSRERQSAARAHSSSVISLQFVDDNLHLLSLGRDRLLRMWDICNAKWIADLAKLSNSMYTSVHHVEMAVIAANSSPPVCIVPDGKFIRIVSMTTGKTLNVLRGHFDQVTSAVVLRDGTYRVISSGYDQSILMWSLQSGWW